MGKVLAGLLGTAVAVAVSGCGSNSFTSACTTCGTGIGGYAGTAFTVQVRAGTQPLAGAQVQVYAAGTSGNGSTASSLLAAAVTTDGGGKAAIPAGYSCPAAGSLLYVVATRSSVSGSTGASSGQVALMSVVGACSEVAANYVATLNEATTAASAYALAAFYGDGGAGTPGSVGASATNAAGLRNAFATAATLADPATGAVPGATLAANVTSPSARLNAVANALNACVMAAAACGPLFSATTVGGKSPGNTLDAVFALTKHPAANVAAVYTQAKLSAVYSPALSATPRDWTMYQVISGGGLNNPSGIGVDSTGAVWVANYFNVASKFTASGAAVFANGVTGSGLNTSYGLAVDLKDNVWIPNEYPSSATGTGSVSELSATGTSLAGSAGYTAGGMNFPLAVAIDPNGTTWVVQFGNSHVSLLNSSGVPVSGASGYTTGLFAFPVAVAIDSNHFGWVVNQASDYVTKVAPDGSSFTNYLCCHLASGIAIDQSNNLWIANYFADSVSLMTNAGVVIGNSYTGGGGIYHPQGIAVDGAGNVWVANYRATYLTELAGAAEATPGAALSPAAGLGGDAGQVEAFALALDASGNVWVSNQGSNTVTKFIGLATPVATPRVGLPKAP